MAVGTAKINRVDGKAAYQVPKPAVSKVANNSEENSDKGGVFMSTVGWGNLLSLLLFSVKDVLTEDDFFRELKREEQRSRRGRRPLPLILIDINRARGPKSSISKAIRKSIYTETRTTDICGVIKTGMVIAIIIIIPTECNIKDAGAAVQIVKVRILDHLKHLTSLEVTDSVNITGYVVTPEEMEKFFQKLYADYTTRPSTEEEHQPDFEIYPG